MASEPIRDLPGSQTGLPEALENAVVAAAERADDEQDEVVVPDRGREVAMKDQQEPHPAGDLPDDLEADLVEVSELPLDRQDDAIAALCHQHPQHAAALWRAIATLRRPSDTAATPPSPAAFLGRLEQVGPYKITGRLGHGGAGMVFAAEHTAIGRRVALKTIRHDYLDDEQAHQRFRREMLALTRLEHPHICRVYEVGDDQGLPFMAMQRIDGEDLGRRIAQAGKNGHRGCVPLPAATTHEPCPATGLPIDIAAVVTFFAKIARAVHAAHDAGLIHRDLKPGNIMVTPEGEPVVLDFGLARPIERGDTRLSHSGDLLGTVEYMAPEQARGDTHAVDHRTDIWAIGVSLYEALCLELPFTGNRQEVLERIQATEPPPLSRRSSALPRDLAVVVAKAIAKEPERRYQSAAELADDLDRVRRLQPILARPIGWVGRLQRWVRRNPVAAALIVTFAMGLSAFSWQYVRAERSVADLAKQTDAAEHFEESGKNLYADLVRARAAAQRNSSAKLADALALAAQGTQAKEAGNLAAAAMLLDQAIPAMRQAEALPWQLAGVLRARAEIAGDLDDVATAERLYQQARDLLAIYHGDDDEETLGVEHDLLRLRLEQGRRGAETAFRAFLKRAGKKLGDNHRILLAGKHNLAVHLRSNGESEEAVELAREALAARLAGDSPLLETLTVKNTLGAALLDLQQVEEARQLFADVVAGRTRELGSDNPLTLNAANSLAAAWVRLGQPAKAEEVARPLLDAYVSRADNAGERHLLRNTLALALARQRRFEEADVEFAGLRRALSAEQPQDHALLAAACTNHGDVLSELARYPDAESALLQAHELRTEHRLAGVDQCRASLARLYDRWQKPEEAAKWHPK
ncbi:MAG: protein kinase [Planctomycetes bacterium]|nr:protein kinase [Planctomycetota bacterium]